MLILSVVSLYPRGKMSKSPKVPIVTGEICVKKSMLSTNLDQNCIIYSSCILFVSNLFYRFLYIGLSTDSFIVLAYIICLCVL